MGRPRKYPPGTSPVLQKSRVKDEVAKFPLGVVKQRATNSRSPHALKFIKSLGDEDTTTGIELIPLLEADPKPPHKIQAFLQKWEENQEAQKVITVRKLAKEIGLTLVDVSMSLSRGMRELGIIEARARVADKITERLGAVIDTLMDQALPQNVMCEPCHGNRKIDGVFCQNCNGTGRVNVLPPHYAFSVKELLKLAQIVEEKQGIQIQQNTVTNKATFVTGGGFMEKLAAMSDRALSNANIEDAILLEAKPKLVLAENNSTEIGEAGTSLSQAVERPEVLV